MLTSATLIRSNTLTKKNPAFLLLLLYEKKATSLDCVSHAKVFQFSFFPCESRYSPQASAHLTWKAKVSMVIASCASHSIGIEVTIRCYRMHPVLSTLPILIHQTETSLVLFLTIGIPVQIPIVDLIITRRFANLQFLHWQRFHRSLLMGVKFRDERPRSLKRPVPNVH